MVTTIIKDIEVSKDNEYAYVYFDYFDKIKYAKVSNSHMNNLLKNSDNKIIEKGLSIQVNRIIVEGYKDKKPLEMYRISKIL